MGGAKDKNTFEHIEGKYSSEVDVSVLCIFFARPDHFAQTFAQVKKARPKRLFLYQDGPRDGRPDDVEKIAACRAIAEDIDWECQVYRNYQEKNVGCDPSMYNAITWMFSHTDKGIILEDDIVASVSFFRFCKEMLDRYENDTRIFKIAGMNHLTSYKEEYADYIFSRRTCIWGWATWKRVIDLFDTEYRFLEDGYAKHMMREQVTAFDEKVETCKWHKNSGKNYFETILWSANFTNNMIDVISTRSLTSNIGIGSNGTHGAGSLDSIPKGLRQVYYKPLHELEFPLRHPSYVIPDLDYEKRVCRILGDGYPLIRFYRGLEGAWLSFRYSSSEDKKKKLGRIPHVIKNLFTVLKR